MIIIGLRKTSQNESGTNLFSIHTIIAYARRGMLSQREFQSIFYACVDPITKPVKRLFFETENNILTDLFTLYNPLFHWLWQPHGQAKERIFADGSSRQHALRRQHSIDLSLSRQHHQRNGCSPKIATLST